MKQLNFSICKNALSIALLLGLLTSCGNPEADAKKLCDCYNKIDSLSSEEDFRKCLRLSEDFTAKYAKDPEKLVRFSRASECADSSRSHK